MNNVDDDALLFGCYLVVRGEAEAAAKDIRTDVDTETGNVGVGAGTAVAFDGDESMVAIYWLHMHRLPNRTAFGIERKHCIEDLHWATLARYGGVKIVPLSADHWRHSVLVDEYAGKPEVRLRFFGIKRIHLDRKIRKTGLIAFVDRALLRNMLLEIGKLPANNARDDIAHAVVVPDLLMLIPRRCLTTLCGPLADFVCIFLVVSQEHAAGAAGNDPLKEMQL